MKKIQCIPQFIRAGIFVFALLSFAGCTQNATSPTSGSSDVIMWTDIDNSGSHTTHTSSTTVSPGLSVDSIVVTSAAFVVSNFQVRSDSSDTDPQDNLFSQQIRSEQFLLDFDTNGRQYIGEHITSAGAYHSARFDIHPIAGRADSLALALGPEYLSLFGGTAVTIPGATVIIKGFVYHGETREPFTYTTNITGAGRVNFDHTLNVPADGTPIEVVVKFKTANAFSIGGILMDPRDPRNTATIDANLKSAIHGSF
ncbi:MAG: hypothetical protein ACHQM6_02690 [Candidatus Kapaibacterium sp.]